jgi:hypothetical protein
MECSTFQAIKHVEKNSSDPKRGQKAHNRQDGAMARQCCGSYQSTEFNI